MHIKLTSSFLVLESIKEKRKERNTHSRTTRLCAESMYEKIFGTQHRLTVLRLYKTILRLHQSLPNELRDLGNQYVRDEFRRHKTAKPEFVTNFMVEWSVSCLEENSNSDLSQS